MTGLISECHLAHMTFSHRPGGLIRCAGIEDRIPFHKTELVGVSLADALGREVAFDLDPLSTEPKAIRVRPIRSAKGAA